MDYSAPVRRARRTDPITSKAAAVNAEKFTGGHYALILAALDRIQTGTAQEIGQAAGLTVVQCARRLPELQKAGLVYVITQGGMPLVRDGFRCWARAVQ
jgi:hypothetical protein